MGMIQNYNDEFNTLPWKDRTRAKQLIDQGLAKIADRPKLSDVLPIARELLRLLPDSAKGNIPEGILRG